MPLPDDIDYYLNYADYLKLDKLLTEETPVTVQNDPFFLPTRELSDFEKTLLSWTLELTQHTGPDLDYHYFAATPRMINLNNMMGTVQPHYNLQNLNFHRDFLYSIYMLEDHFRKNLAGNNFPGNEIDTTVVVMCAAELEARTRETGQSRSVALEQALRGLYHRHAPLQTARRGTGRHSTSSRTTWTR